MFAFPQNCRSLLTGNRRDKEQHDGDSSNQHPRVVHRIPLLLSWSVNLKLLSAAPFSAEPVEQADPSDHCKIAMASTMISALFMGIRRIPPVLVLWLLLSVFAPSLSSTSDGSKQPSGTGLPVGFSANDFDWRAMVPFLFAATALPGEQAITAMLENSRVLRVYVANEVRAECRADKRPCAAKGDGSTLDGEVDKRIAEIVQEGIFHRHNNAVVDYQLSRQPFPFSEIAAVKSEKKSDAYLMLALADRSYTAAQVQDKYGAPYDTNIFQWYSAFKYRVKNADYTSDAVFEIDPVDGAVIKIAVSVKPRKHR